MRGRLQLALMVMALSVLMASTARAERVKSSVPTLQGGIEGSNTQRSDRSQPITTTKIQRLNEIELPTTSVKDLFSQSSTPNTSSPIQITAVRAVPTEQGVEVILETPFGEQLQITNRSSGKNYIADIPNAQLRLPSGDAFTFRSEKPVDGVTEITVTNLDANTLRVTVTGETALPTVELFDSDAGLVVGVVTATSPTPPTSETPQEDDSIEIVVTGEQDEGYNPSSASTATRTDTPLRDIPQSIQVVPRQAIEDQQITRVGDALENVSGVTNAGLYNNYLDYIWLRGFPTFQGNFFRDGVRLNSYFIGFGTEDLANLERIEVLKGPASVLFGAVEPGGVINFITKSPLREPAYSLTASAGSYSSYRGEVDLTGSLNEERTSLYRINSYYANSGSFRDSVDSERFAVAPTLFFEFSPQTTLRIDGNFSRLHTTPDSGIPAIGDRPANVPRNRSIDEPFSNFVYEDLTVGYTLNHKFSDVWLLEIYLDIKVLSFLSLFNHLLLTSMKLQEN